MSRNIFIIYICLIGCNILHCQDIIYMVSGQKIEANIKEISKDGISYKNYNDIDTNSSSFFINRISVVVIKYNNGVTEIFNANPNELQDQVSNLLGSSAKSKKVDDLYSLNKNLLSINSLALANGDFTLMYDRDVLNNKIQLSFLGGYNFNSRMGALNLYITDSKDKAKKLFDAGIGINYLFDNTISNRINYFVGFLGKYMVYNYQQLVDTTNNQKKYQPATGNQISLMLTNGCLFRISPNFNVKIICSIGKSINSVSLDKINDKGEKIDYSNFPKMYLGYCFGYRF
ncbi:MAG: hypothetical protein K9H41_00170 [Bacteroidia bacterium]|nr:hypothetical protein [Bacteroidia bacterium]